MINGVHHVAISTPDLERITAFYCDVLHFEPVAYAGGWERGSDLIDRIVGLRDSACRQQLVRCGNLFIEFFEYSSPPPRRQATDRPVCDHGYTHIALDVTDIDAEYARLTAAGMRFHHPPVHDPEAGLAATYGRDPDGNVVEIQEVTDQSHAFRLQKR